MAEELDAIITKILDEVKVMVLLMNSPKSYQYFIIALESLKVTNLRCTKILSQCHLFLFFLPSPFLPHKKTFMDDYDGI